MFIPSAKRAPRTLTLKVNGVINVHPKREARPKTFIVNYVLRTFKRSLHAPC